MKTCHSCGMPLAKLEDHAGGDENANFCVHCVNADGNVKACKEIFEGGVNFFLAQTNGDSAFAEKITRKSMNMQPYWKGREEIILQGPEATDEEFREILSNLMN